MSIPSLGFENNTHECQECGMKFYNSGELVNHMKKFCTAAGLNSLSGLAQYEQQSKFSNRMKTYGAHSLGSMKYEPTFDPDELAKQARNVGKHKQQLDAHRVYSNTANHDKDYESQSNRMRTDMGYQNIQVSNVQRFKDPQNHNSRAVYGQRVLGASEVSIKSIHGFGSQAQPRQQPAPKQKLRQEDIFHSPPSNLLVSPFAKRPGPSVLGKSNSSIQNMTPEEKKQYASDKLVQLDNIAELYDKGGGKNMDFRKNVDKMRKFYKKMLEGHQDREEPPVMLINSRAQTPISKLDEFNSQSILYDRKKSRAMPDSLDRELMKKPSIKKPAQTQAKTKKKKLDMSLNYPQFPQSFPQPYLSQFYPPFPQQQPQIIMLPSYSQPLPASNTSELSEQIKYFQKMLQVKNQENKKLMKMLIDTKRQKDQGQLQQKVQHLQKSIVSLQPTARPLYHMETPMVSMPSTEQKLLLALQREQLDELRLLATLPPELQALKMESVMKLIEQRTEIEKEILQQKVRRLEEQQRLQLQEEELRLEKDEWANGQRKQLIGRQMEDILGKFRKRVNGEDSDEDDEQEEEEEEEDDEGEDPEGAEL